MPYQRVRLISGRGPAASQFADALRGLAVDAADRIYAVGDSAVKVFSPEGELVGLWQTERAGWAIAVAKDRTVFVGQTDQAQLFDPAGHLTQTWKDPQRLGLPTAVGLCGEHVLVADAKDRCIRCYDLDGRFRHSIGGAGRMRGFLIPNGHLDLTVDADGVLHVPNPGKHRVERYDLSGRLLGQFGRFDGTDPAGFSGCCNPTNIALLPSGQVVVTEKAPPRIKVYEADGRLLELFGQDDFDPRCKNMDVAADSRGRVYVVDTIRLHICVFAPAEAQDATSRPATREGQPR